MVRTDIQTALTTFKWYLIQILGGGGFRITTTPSSSFSYFYKERTAIIFFELSSPVGIIRGV